MIISLVPYHLAPSMLLCRRCRYQNASGTTLPHTCPYSCAATSRSICCSTLRFGKPLQSTLCAVLPWNHQGHESRCLFYQLQLAWHFPRQVQRLEPFYFQKRCPSRSEP